MSLYPPPEIIETEVFAEVPAAYRKEGVYSKWSAANNKGETIDSFIEGPSFDRDGNLYIVDIPWGRVFRVSRGDLIRWFEENPGLHLTFLGTRAVE